MSWLAMVSTSLTTVRTSIADAAKVVYVDKTEAVEGIPLRENMLWVGVLERVEGLLGVLQCRGLALSIFGCLSCDHVM